MVQLLVALAVVGATAFIGRGLGLSMSVADVPMSSSRFWWIMALFAAPLGIANQVLFADGLLLQLSLVIAVAGGGIWIGERLFGWGKRL